MARVSLCLAMIVLFSVLCDNCIGRGCVCRKYTKYECEATQIIQADGSSQSVCSWEATHGRCRNTDWLECKQDPNCIWIKKTVDTSSACDADVDDDDEEQDLSALYPHNDNDMNAVAIKTDSVPYLSSTRSHSTYLQAFALSVAFAIIFGGTIRHFYKNTTAKQGTLLFPSNRDHTQYSTF
mmetsp:Transcript_7328/g.12021  ORF Transcript_7328/g.12021 Transcript_7328/m.12021 type:complete len:181 (+) Transcript_7328:91-633(+)